MLSAKRRKSKEPSAQSINSSTFRGTVCITFEIAVIHIGLNDTNSAFKWLEKAYDQRVTRMRALRDPLFDGLRPHPRFATLMARVNLPM